jgi:Amt family ammonium transporter
MAGTMASQEDLAAAIDALRTEMINSRRDLSLVSGADTAWILTCTCLVLMMTIPGLALFYGGLSQAPNVLATMMQSFTITCLISFLWLICGYTIAFGPDGNDIVGGGSRAWLDKTVQQGSGTIPDSLFAVFQCTFAIITAAIITGSTAERMRFLPLLIFIGIWHLLVYAPLAHFEWGGGFMSKWGVLDFAGGDVVHISSGVSGLAASLVVGKRKCFASGATPPPHNILLVFMGGSLLWVGWFGFNAGSALGASNSAAMAMLVTHISASVGGLSWMTVEWLHVGKPSVLGAVSGAVAGLVVITPGSGYLDQTGAFICGLTAGPICYLGIKIKNMLGFDDALDAFGVHGVGGIWGGILTGILANPDVSEGNAGAAYGNPKQIGIQLAGIVFTMAFSFIMTLVILIPLDQIFKAITKVGVRVTEEVEDTGLDISEHGESMVSQHEHKFDAGKVEPMITTVQNDGA